MSTALNSLSDNLVKYTGVAPASYTATQTGTARDFITGDGNCFAMIHVGALTSTGTLDVKIQESDTTTSGDFGDITGATFTQVSATGTGPVFINFQRSKRYLRMVGTIGSSPTYVWGGVIFEKLKQVPA